MDEERRIIGEAFVRNRVDELARVFGQIEPMRIALEASTKAFWMADRLREFGHDPVVVDPGRTKAIGAALIKHDKLDARVLATLCAANVLAVVDQPTVKQRLSRIPVVVRDGLVRSRVRLVTMGRSILDSEGFELPRCSPDNYADCVFDGMWNQLPEEMQNALEPALNAIRDLSHQISDCDARLKDALDDDEDVKLLKSAPGVGTIVAAGYIMAVRDPSRFTSGRQVGAYLGLVPSLYQSGKTHRLGRITKRGNRQARWLLSVAANALLRSRSPSALQEWGKKLVVKLGRKKAVTAIARKLAAVLWAMWRDRRPFEPRLVTA